MKKPSAACALDWSVELEKGLRSNRPGQHLESIQLTGHRIQRWCREPNLKLAVYNMFKMVHGEERLYADAILLRLANAFSAGDRDTKIHILEVFLSERRCHRRKRRQEYGIFSKITENSRLELLRRIKVALSDADTEPKALALVLVGCWSDITMDTPEMRYAILSSLLSPNDMEVKAALFAAGFFSEASYDFASAFLEMLISMVASPKTSSTVKAAAAWSFRRMGHFHSLINKAYKSGSEIMQKSSEDYWLVPLLISLSKLASKSMLLSSEQVRLLCSVATHVMTPHMQLVVMRCLRFMLEKTFLVTFGAFSFETLFRTLDGKEASPALKCEALQLVKIVSCLPYDMLFVRIQEFNKVVELVGAVIRSPESLKPDRALAAQLLVGISNKINHREHIVAEELNIFPIISGAVLSIGDEVISQMKQMSEYCTASEVELGLKRLLQVLFLLLDGPPEVSVLVLDKLCFVFNYLVNKCAGNTDATGKISSVEENVLSLLMPMFTDYAYKGLSAYIERLCAAYATTAAEIFDKLNHLVSFVCQCNLFNCCTRVKYALLMHYICNFGCQSAENGEKVEERCVEVILLCNSIVDQMYNTGCLNNLLASNDNWAAYLVGKHASCQGAWFVSKSVFAYLETKVQSDIFSHWLRCLSQFARSENSFQELFLQTHASVSMDTSMASSGSMAKLISACEGLSLTDRLLGASGTLEQTCFQRWFLALRMKVLAVIVDLFNLFDTVSFSREAIISISQQGKGENDSVCSHRLEREATMCLLDGISSKMLRIAQEYDLLNSSFMDVDGKSFRVVSSIALSCSLLAFCTAFAYFIPNSPLPEGLKGCSSKDSDCCLHTASIKDMVGRLSHVEPETSMNIISVLKGDVVHEASIQSQCRSHSFNSVYEAGNISRLCRTTVEGIQRMQNETAGISDDFLLPEVLNRRTCFLFEAARAWMRIPFRIPKFFFQVRPCVGAILFSCSADSNSLGRISVLHGSILSLNLCLELKNMPEELHSRIKRISCILHCTNSPHNNNPPETSSPDYQSWTTDSMMRLHEKLRWHVMERAGEELITNEGDTHCSDGSVAETFVTFEMRGGVQGFASCSLDVSAFPCGSYKIYWQCCCVGDRGSFWSLLPLSPEPEFTVRSSRS